LAREDRLLKYLDLSKLGIEIAPYFNPLIKKKDGHEVLTVDILDAASLRETAKKDPHIPDERIDDIEDVDIVASALEIEREVTERGLAGKISYIVSSHNFEHLPDPIRFLQGCYRVLAPGGILSMAIPDCRATFDHYRFPTRLAEWLEAYFEQRKQPTLAQIFDQNAFLSSYYINGEGAPQPGCSLREHSPVHHRPEHRLDCAFDNWRRFVQSDARPYVDAHCSLVFGKTFELMIGDLTRLGMLHFEILEISDTEYHEFFVHLKKPDQNTSSTQSFDFEERDKLLMEINQQLGWWAYPAWRERQLQRLQMEAIDEEVGDNAQSAFDKASDDAGESGARTAEENIHDY